MFEHYQMSGSAGYKYYLHEVMDRSWYSGIETYLSDSIDAIIESIIQEEGTHFKEDPKAAVTVATDGHEYFVAIYTFP